MSFRPLRSASPPQNGEAMAENKNVMLIYAILMHYLISEPIQVIAVCLYSIIGRRLCRFGIEMNRYY
ncbi:Uncharacterised protein [Shigella sonnei]|nr:Uncharacterised protein [Shigella sonnei]